jgi:predicted PurR-regulated permease PerM
VSLPSSSSPPEIYEWTFRRVVWATLVFVAVAFGFWLIYRFYQAIFILFVAIVIGTVIRPLVNWLYLKGVPRMAGVVLVYLLLLVALIGFAFLLFPLLTQQMGKVMALVPDYYQGLRDWVINYPNQLISHLSVYMPETLPLLRPIQQTGLDVTVSPEQVLGYLAKLSGVLFILIIIPVLAFYWTLDGPRTIQSFLLMLPLENRDAIRELITAMENKVGSFVAGQGILCLAIGVMALISYMLIGLPNALVLALMAGVLEAVPMLGPMLGAMPAALVALSMGPDKLLWVIAASIIIQQLENNLLVPRVMRRAVGVNPFVTLLAIFAFSSLFGIAGALMAIPIAAILQLLLDHFVFHPASQEPDISNGRDYASRLRYEAQNLAQDLRKQVRVKKEGTELNVRQIDVVMDEIEAITMDLDALLSQVASTEES